MMKSPLPVHVHHPYCQKKTALFLEIHCTRIGYQSKADYFKSASRRWTKRTTPSHVDPSRTISNPRTSRIRTFPPESTPDIMIKKR